MSSKEQDRRGRKAADEEQPVERADHLDDEVYYPRLHSPGPRQPSSAGPGLLGAAGAPLWLRDWSDCRAGFLRWLAAADPSSAAHWQQLADWLAELIRHRRPDSAVAMVRCLVSSDAAGRWTASPRFEQLLVGAQTEAHQRSGGLLRFV